MSRYSRAYYQTNKLSINAKAMDRYHRRRELIAALKALRGNMCVDCKVVFSDPAMLDFDHREPQLKLFPIGRNIMLSLEAIMAEVDKCDLRCPNCHRARTLAEKHCMVRR